MNREESADVEVESFDDVIAGQEAETLAGHVDLTGFFPLRAQPAAPTASATPAQSSGAKVEPPKM